MILVGSVAILLAKAARQPGWRAGTQNSGVPPPDHSDDFRSPYPPYLRARMVKVVSTRVLRERTRPILT